MRLFDEKSTIEGVKRLESEVRDANPGRDITMVYSQEKKPSGYVNFTFTIKSTNKSLRKSGCINRISMYVFEEKRRVQTFIINSITMRILFYNFTVNSPEIGLHYLKDTLYHGIEWMKKKESDAEKNISAKPNYAKRSQGNRGGQFKKSNYKSSNFKGKPNNNEIPRKSYKPGNTSKVPYKNPGSSNTRYNKSNPYKGGYKKNG